MSSILETVFNTSPLAILIADSQYKICMVNDTAVSLFGYSRKEIQDQSVDVLVPARARPSHAEKMEKYTSSPDTRAMGGGRDLGAVKKNGAYFPAEIGLNPIVHEGKSYIVVSIVDISLRKQEEEESLKKIKALFVKTEADL